MLSDPLNPRLYPELVTSALAVCSLPAPSRQPHLLSFIPWVGAATTLELGSLEACVASALLADCCVRHLALWPPSHLRRNIHHSLGLLINPNRCCLASFHVNVSVLKLYFASFSSLPPYYSRGHCKVTAVSAQHVLWYRLVSPPSPPCPTILPSDLSPNLLSVVPNWAQGGRELRLLNAAAH